MPRYREERVRRLCDNCGRDTDGRVYRGQCHTCDEYRRRYGKDRPYKVDGRTERYGYPPPKRARLSEEDSVRTLRPPSFDRC